MRPTSLRLLCFILGLHLAWCRLQGQENSLAYKYEFYDEEADRVRIEAHYVRGEVALGSRTSLAVTGLRDAISGESPNGLLPEVESDPLPRGRLPGEVRYGAVADLSHRVGAFTGIAQASYSDEPDYVSTGGALTGLWETNGRSTTLRLGLGYQDDDVLTSRYGQDKDLYEALVGVTHFLNARCLLSANLGYGHLEGYLSDPYKFIGLRVPGGIPGLPDPITAYDDKRPGTRDKGTLQLGLTLDFPKLAGTLEGSNRVFWDSWGTVANTAEIAWLQNLGDHVVLRPLVRYHLQSAVDFYYVSLDGTGIDPEADPNAQPGSGRAPWYSSDYRLSELQTFSAGLKLTVLLLDEALALDLAYERYTMRGLDGETRQEAYPQANILTAGIRWTF